MKKFITSLNSRTNSITFTSPLISLANDAITIFGCTDSNAITYNVFATQNDGSCIYETSDTLNTDDVNFIALIGHSQIAGKGKTYAPGSPLGDYMQDVDKIINDAKYSYAGGTFYEYNPATLPTEHGREAYINLLWKDYLDSSNGEPLYMAKSIVVGAAPHSKFMIGGRYWQNTWNNQIRTKINELVSLGKKVVIYFIFDMWGDDSIYGTNNEMFDINHSHWCVARALGIKEINANITTSASSNTWQENMNNSFMNYVLEDPTHRSLSNGIGEPTTDGVHWSANSLKLHAINHLTAMQLQPKMKISWNIPEIKGITMAFKHNNYQIARNFWVSWDIACEVRVFTNEEKLYEKAISSFRLNLSLYRYGFVTLIGDLTGITRFEAPYTGTCVEFELVDKYLDTLSYIDLRGNSLPSGNSSYIVDYSNDYNVMRLSQGTIENGVLKIKDSIYGLTIASRNYYDILISRGWEIDVNRP